MEQHLWLGSAAATQFWIDPREELIGLLMTQHLEPEAPVIEGFVNLAYQAIAD